MLNLWTTWFIKLMAHGKNLPWSKIVSISLYSLNEYYTKRSAWPAKPVEEPFNPNFDVKIR